MSLDILKWIRGMHLFDKISPELKTAIHIGVIVVEKIKQFIETPLADVVTAIIPGEIDDTVKNLLREYLPRLFVELRLADSCVDLTDPNEIVACALKTLQQIEGDFKNAFLHDISILVAQVAADGKLDWMDGVYLTEYYYQHHIKHD
jgi:hypothetical protein